MRCNDCGFEYEEGFSYCPRCGSGPQPATVSENYAALAILPALKDTLFLLICILISASCILSISAGNLPLLNILLAVFLWLTYARSCKDIADPQHLRSISGTVYANYVITYVAAGIFAVLGFIIAFAFQMLLSDTALLNTFLDSFIELDDYTAAFITSLSAIGGTALIVIFLLVAAIIIALNVFSMRYIHRFAKSVYQSIQNGVLELKHVTGAQIWLFIFGAFSGLSALSELVGGGLDACLSSAASCAACILAGVLIRKYLLPKN